MRSCKTLKSYIAIIAGKEAGEAYEKETTLQQGGKFYRNQKFKTYTEALLGSFKFGKTKYPEDIPEGTPRTDFWINILNTIQTDEDDKTIPKRFNK